MDGSGSKLYAVEGTVKHLELFGSATRESVVSNEFHEVKF
jgi:hypothetical protein